MSLYTSSDAESGDYPDIAWAKEVCKIGKGKDCCRYLTASGQGWSCEKHSDMGRHLDRRVREGKMTARGDNCVGKDSR